MQPGQAKALKNQEVTVGMHLVPHGFRAMRQAAGFTLIEILIVVALISVLAGTAAPIVAEGIRQYAINSAGQQVASTIRAARFQAVARNQTLQVRFDYPAAGQYQVVDTALNAVGEVQRLPDGITFGAGFTNLQISNAGRMTAASNIVVTNGSAEHDRTIVVSTSGRIQLQ
jgi:prepilin-type N-terminal cleavage/methylation domain-containing protein